MPGENLVHQQQSVELFHWLRENPEIESAYTDTQKHPAVIQRFGHFPDRNKLLDRASPRRD